MNDNLAEDPRPGRVQTKHHTQKADLSSKNQFIETLTQSHETWTPLETHSHTHKENSQKKWELALNKKWYRMHKKNIRQRRQGMKIIINFNKELTDQQTWEDSRNLRDQRQSHLLEDRQADRQTDKQTSRQTDRRVMTHATIETFQLRSRKDEAMKVETNHQFFFKAGEAKKKNSPSGYVNAWQQRHISSSLVKSNPVMPSLARTEPSNLPIQKLSCIREWITSKNWFRREAHPENQWNQGSQWKDQ